MGIWHDIILGEAERIECWHCKRVLPRSYMSGDHHPYSRGARPDLKFDIRNGVPSCFSCQNSGEKRRNKPTPEQLAPFLPQS